MVNRNKQWFFGILLSVCSYGYIAYKIKNLNIDFSGIDTNTFDIALFFLFIILAILNIMAESVKWKLFMASIYPVTLRYATQMVLAGFTSGIFTPSKLGEPIGRIISLPKTLWTKATLLNYLGGFLQNIVIFLMGFIFLSSCYLNGEEYFDSVFSFSLLVLFVALCLLLIIWAYRNKLKLTQFKLLNQLSVLKELPLLTYGKISIISMARYVLYCTQLALLLFMFAPDGYLTEYFMLIPIYFMCITVIPSFVLADLGVRNSVALLLFSSIQINEISIVLSVSTLWLINQVIPALLGSISFLGAQKVKSGS